MKKITYIILFTAMSYGLASGENEKGIDSVANLIQSVVKSDRLKGARHIYLIGDNQLLVDSIDRLLNDPDTDIAGNAALGLCEICEDKRLSIDQAKKIMLTVRGRLDKNDDAKSGVFEDTESGMWVLFTHSLALRSLYFQYNLVSPAEYNAWEVDFLQPVLMTAIARRERLSDRCFNLILPLLNIISDPGAVYNAVAAINESWTTIAPQRVVEVLRFLWLHRYLGEARVMHASLKDLLKNKLAELRVVSDMAGNNEERNFLLMKIEEINRWK